MKTGKSSGPDDIPNEVFKEAEESFIDSITKVMNNIAQEKKKYQNNGRKAQLYDYIKARERKENALMNVESHYLVMWEKCLKES